MALKMRNSSSHRHDVLDGVVVDKRLLTDIVDVLTPDGGFTRSHDKISLSVNEYEADDIDDVMSFDRPVESISITCSSDTITVIHLTLNQSAILWDADKGMSGAVGKIKTLLAARRVESKRNPPVPRWYWATIPVTFVIGAGTSPILRELGVKPPPTLLGPLIQLALMFLIVCVLWARDGARPPKAMRKSLLEEPGKRENFVRRHTVEVTVSLSAAAIVATIVLRIIFG